MASASNRYKTDGICRCYINSRGTKIVCWTHWPFPIEGMNGRPAAIGKDNAQQEAPKQADLFGGAAA